MKPILDFFSEQHYKGSKVVITTHYRPDADAMGSTLSLAEGLRQLGISQATVITPNAPANYLLWMPHIDKIIAYDQAAEQANTYIKEADFIFSLDYNTFKRIGKMEEVINSSPQPKILIDHHQSPAIEHFAYGYTDPKKSSTSEMVFDVFKMLGIDKDINEATMQLIYAGIVGDTGSFAYPSTTIGAFDIGHQFKQRGLKTHHVYEQLFQNNSLNKIKFAGYAISNLMQIFEAEQASLIAISLEDYQKYNLQTGDLEQLVNIPLTIKQIQFSAMAVGLTSNTCKWSFRSLGKIDVNKFARSHFNGGGHINAAGAFLEKSLDEAIKLFTQVIPTIKVS